MLKLNIEDHETFHKKLREGDFLNMHRMIGGGKLGKLYSVKSLKGIEKILRETHPTREVGFSGLIDVYAYYLGEVVLRLFKGSSWNYDGLYPVIRVPVKRSYFEINPSSAVYKFCTGKNPDFSSVLEVYKRMEKEYECVANGGTLAVPGMKIKKHIQ
ncbi:hypothetical protein IMZ31_24400 (plasmid) [Pontibacillus sp. ALD_SL1]|uniref:hypothetical protein n=1 Tax=Pontibacillus sp. ALD_SL1 TaxID=2777185 RepID=UPI001A956496|nr:hypothetical protein [Pontibacillus sp. ALD_SL1]QST02595.1 hypothetical protein IMZ31_24400 [Pontibacillus sp. ALD_SL1]